MKVCELSVSIRAPAPGATFTQPSLTSSFFGFNPPRFSCVGRCRRRPAGSPRRALLLRCQQRGLPVPRRASFPGAALRPAHAHPWLAWQPARRSACSRAVGSVTVRPMLPNRPTSAASPPGWAISRPIPRQSYTDTRRTAQPLTRLDCGGYPGFFPGLWVTFNSEGAACTHAETRRGCDPSDLSRLGMILCRDR